MTENKLRKFKNMAELYRSCFENHVGLITLAQFEHINDNIDQLGEPGDCATIHIPYIEYGVKRYTIPVIEQDNVEYVVPNDNRGYIHLIDASCLGDLYIHSQPEWRTTQDIHYFIDYSIYFKCTPDGYQKTSLKLRFTIENVIINGRKRAVWVRSEALNENY
jgi:hypothetical protein